MLKALEIAMDILLLLLTLIQEAEASHHPTHCGYGKILSGHTLDWETSPTFEGTPESINHQIQRWFTKNGHDSPIAGFIPPWAVYTKPIQGGSYELWDDQGNADLLLHASIGIGLANKAPQTQYVQDVINKLFDLDYIKSQCRALGQHGMALWAQVPEFDSPVQHVREAVIGGYVADSGNGTFSLTDKGLDFAQTEVKDFNSRTGWHGWTVHDV